MLLSSGFQQPTPVPGGLKGYAGGGGGNPFILTQTLGTLRSNFTGCIGYSFDVGGSNITVDSVARWKVAGNSQTHTVKITNIDQSIVLATAAIDLTTGSAGTFVYASVTPVVLSAATTYLISSSETNGGDQFYDDDTTPTSTAAYATLGNSVFASACTSGTAFSPHLAGKTYVPVNFRTP